MGSVIPVDGYTQFTLAFKHKKAELIAIKGPDRTERRKKAKSNNLRLHCRPLVQKLFENHTFFSQVWISGVLCYISRISKHRAPLCHVCGALKVLTRAGGKCQLCGQEQTDLFTGKVAGCVFPLNKTTVMNIGCDILIKVRPKENKVRPR